MLYDYNCTKNELLGGLIMRRSKDLATVRFAVGQSVNGLNLFNKDQTGRVIRPTLLVDSKIFYL